MRSRTRFSRFGNRTIVRLLAAAFAISLLIFWFRGPRSSRGTLPESRQQLPNLPSKDTAFEFAKDVDVPSSYNPSKPYIGKVTYLWQSEDETWARVLQTHKHHNDRFGYPMFVLRKPMVEGSWNKPVYLLSVLSYELRKPEGQRLKWLFWVDQETVLMNPKIPLEAFLPPTDFPDIHLVATADGNGVNLGAFFIKVHPWSIAILNAIVAFRTYRPHIELKHHDQSAMKELLIEKQFKHNFTFVPQRWFNAYTRELYDSRRPWQLKPGDLLLHFPDLPHNEEEFHTLLDRSFMHLREFEVDYEKTTYPQEIEGFWTKAHDQEANEKAEAAKAAENAHRLLKRTSTQLGYHRDEIGKESTGKIEAQMAALRLSLRDRGFDKEATTLYHNRLHEVSKILYQVAARGRQDLVKRAKKALASSKEHFVPLNDDLHEDAKKDLNSRQDDLRELLKQSPIDDGDLILAVEELELMIKEMDVMIRERDTNTL